MYRKSITIIFIILSILACTGCAGPKKDVASDKKRAEALQNLGASYVRDGKLREGLKNLHEAVKLDPNNAELHNQIALVYMDLAKYEIRSDCLASDHFPLIASFEISPQLPIV